MCTRPSPGGGGRTSCLCQRADPSKDRLLLPWEPRVQWGTRREHTGDTYCISTVAVVRCGGRAGHCGGGHQGPQPIVGGEGGSRRSDSQPEI